MEVVDCITEGYRMTQEARDRVVAEEKAERDRVVWPAQAEYERIDAEAQAEYRRIDAEAQAEYRRIDAEAQAKYDRVIWPAKAEYKCVVALAEAEYKRAIAPAEAEYKRAITEANAKRVDHSITNEEQRSVYKKVESVAIANFRSAVINHPGSGIAAQRIRKQAQAEYDHAIAEAKAEYKRVTGEDYEP